jgi:two-component system, NtrC family, sensor kinase
MDNEKGSIIEKELNKHTDRLASVEHLIASANHEINNALSVVIPKLRLIENHFAKLQETFSAYRSLSNSKNYEEFQNLLAEIQNIDSNNIDNNISKIKNYLKVNLEILLNVKRIVESMRCFKFLSDNIFESFNINDCIRTVLSLLDHIFEKKNIKLVINLKPEELLLKGSPGEFLQIILNCLNNSIDALFDKKSHNHDFIPEISISTFVENDFIIAKIRDNGTGIDPSIMDKIFEPYVTTKPKNKGTGLGLSIVKDIIEKFYGIIELDSIVNEYAEFRFKFPNPNR